MTESNKNKVILVGDFHEVIELCQICKNEIFGIIDKSDRIQEIISFTSIMNNKIRKSK